MGTGGATSTGGLAPQRARPNYNVAGQSALRESFAAAAAALPAVGPPVQPAPQRGFYAAARNHTSGRAFGTGTTS